MYIKIENIYFKIVRIFYNITVYLIKCSHGENSEETSFMRMMYLVYY